jgi:hypothetical protein
VWGSSRQTGLHSLARPVLKWRAIRVFRDITSIPAGPDLGAAIQQRLRDSDSAPGLRTQALVKRCCVIVGQDADEQVMGRRPFAAEVAQGAAGEFVTPDVRV